MVDASFFTNGVFDVKAVMLGLELYQRNFNVRTHKKRPRSSLSWKPEGKLDQGLGKETWLEVSLSVKIPGIELSGRGNCWQNVKWQKSSNFGKICHSEIVQLLIVQLDVIWLRALNELKAFVTWMMLFIFLPEQKELKFVMLVLRFYWRIFSDFRAITTFWKRMGLK